MLFQNHPSDIIKNVLCHMVAASCTEIMSSSISCDQIYLLVPNSLLGISSHQGYLPMSSAMLVFVQGSASPGLDKLSFMFPSPIWLCSKIGCQNNINKARVKDELKLAKKTLSLSICIFG